jgi:hypothetical protein
MRWFVCVAFLSACATLSGATPEEDHTYYLKTVERLLRRNQDRDNPTPALKLDEVDYLRLRRGAAVQRTSVAWRAQDDLAAANAIGDDRRALQQAMKLLEADFASVDAHLTQARALHDAGRAGAASFHDELARRLLESMLEGGDGSTGRPFRVIDGREMEMVGAIVRRPSDPTRLHFAVLKR